MIHAERTEQGTVHCTVKGSGESILLEAIAVMAHMGGHPRPGRGMHPGGCAGDPQGVCARPDAGLGAGRGGGAAVVSQTGWIALSAVLAALLATGVLALPVLYGREKEKDERRRRS